MHVYCPLKIKMKNNDAIRECVKTNPRNGVESFIEFTSRVNKYYPTNGGGHNVLIRGGQLFIPLDTNSISDILELAREYEFIESDEYSIFNLLASESALKKGEIVTWNIRGYQKADDLITMQEWVDMNNVVSIDTAKKIGIVEDTREIVSRSDESQRAGEISA